MKILISTVIATLGLGGAYSYSLYQRNQLQQQQLNDYQLHVEQLLTQVEGNSLQRLDYEEQIEELESELTMVSSQLTAASNQLQVAQTQSDPDYQRVESEIRRQVRQEFQQQIQESPEQARVNLVKELAALDPVELGEIMTLQGQFGGFLQSLDVSDERMEVIVSALGNLIADQNQQRMDLMMDARSQGTGRREIRGDLFAINSPEAQLEALAFDLTEEELDLLSEFQTNRGNQRNFTQSFMANPTLGPESAVIFSGGRVQRGSGSAQAIPIPRGDPQN